MTASYGGEKRKKNFRGTPPRPRQRAAPSALPLYKWMIRVGKGKRRFLRMTCPQTAFLRPGRGASPSALPLYEWMFRVGKFWDLLAGTWQFYGEYCLCIGCAEHGDFSL